MNSLIYCLLSCGDLKLLPFDTRSPTPIPQWDQKDDDTLELPLAVPTPTSSLSVAPSPTPEVIDMNNDTILNSTHSAHSLYLPNQFITLSSAQVDSGSSLRTEIFKILSVVFPSWRHIDDLEIKQLTGGITNMLLSVTNPKSAETVLIRTYGQGTGLIIDRDREFVSQLFLNSLNLASPIHARFGNGLVYGFLPGRSLSPEELSHPKLFPLIAQRLGHWHDVIKGEDILDGVIKLRSLRDDKTDEQGGKLFRDVWELIADWIKVLPEIPTLLETCVQYQDYLELKNTKSLQEILTAELKWLIANISTKSPVVSCHSDLLSGNVIIPDSLSATLNSDSTEPTLGKVSENPISFIDYEYMVPAPRAFDISNHFMEWQGFECDKSKIPVPSKDNPIMRSWAKAYLSIKDNYHATDAEIDGLINEIELFYGLPGFYWGIWSGIQSSISLIDFDYKGYCSQRLEEYFVWKVKYLS